MASKECKMLVTVGGNEFVMSASDASAVLEMFASAERYEHYTDWGAKEEDRAETHHVWEESAVVTIKSMPLGLYQCAKLAGKRVRK